MLLVPLSFPGAVLTPVLEGFLPNASLALGGATVFATVLLGKRSGYILLALETTALLVVSVLHLRGVISVVPGYEEFAVLRPGAIARYVLLFAVTSASLLVAVSYLLSRAERLLLDKTLTLLDNAKLLEEHRRAEDEMRFCRRGEQGARGVPRLRGHARESGPPCGSALRGLVHCRHPGGGAPSPHHGSPRRSFEGAAHRRAQRGGPLSRD